MEKILNSIEKLLAVNEHIIVPGLGGFFVQHQPARICGKYMTPPHATISFNPLLTQNDGMLIVEVSRANKISYREAAAITEKETKEFLKKLTTHRKQSFGRLGVFFLENESRMHFFPATELSFLPANFGLQKLALPKKISKSKNITFTIPSLKLMRYAALFITFVALLFSSHLNESSNIIKAGFGNLSPVNLPGPEKNSKLEIPDTKETTPNVSSKNTYKIIVAAFDSKTKAAKLRKKLIAKDYPKTEIIETSNNIRVAIRSFDNMISAVNYMKQVRSSDARFPDAWVMKTNR